MPSAKIDYSNPIFSAAIFNPNTGDRFPFTANIDPAVLERAGVPASLRSLAFLTEVSVEIDLGPVPILSATLSPPYDMGVAFLESPLIEYGVTHLEVQVGYGSGTGGGPVLSPKFEGIMLQPEVSYGSDISITLNAQGVGGFSALRQTSNQTFDNLTRIEIIKKLAAGNPQSPRSLSVDDSLVLKARGAGVLSGIGEGLTQLFTGQGSAALSDALAALPKVNEYGLLYEQPRTFVQGYKTDWWAIHQLVRECRCTMYLQGDTIIIVPLNLALAAAPVRTYRFMNFPGGQLDTSKGEVPILSATTDTKAIYLPGALRGLHMDGIDSKLGERVSALVNDEVARTTRTGAGAGAPGVSDNFQAADGEGGGGDHAPGSPTDNLALTQAISAVDAFTQNMGITLNLETLGDPLLNPADVIAIKGLTRRLDGNYAVFKITHSVGSDGYSMSLTAVSNVGQLVSAARSTTAAPPEPFGTINEKEPVADNTGGVPVGEPEDPT